MLTSLNLKFERESHVHEIPNTNHLLGNDNTMLLRNDNASSEEKLEAERSNRLIFAHLNINSERNKFDLTADILKNNVDILVISEAKIDFLKDSFNFMATLNHVDLLGMEMVVKYFYQFVRIYRQDL